MNSYPPRRSAAAVNELSVISSREAPPVLSVATMLVHRILLVRQHTPSLIATCERALQSNAAITTRIFIMAKVGWRPVRCNIVVDTFERQLSCCRSSRLCLCETATYNSRHNGRNPEVKMKAIRIYEPSMSLLRFQRWLEFPMRSTSLPRRLFRPQD
jgi:hypothetical protein